MLQTIINSCESKNDLALIKLMLLENINENEEFILDFGKDNYTAAAILFEHFLQSPDDPFINNLFRKLLKENKGLLSGFKIYEVLEKRGVVQKINDMLYVLEIGTVPFNQVVIAEVHPLIYAFITQSDLSKISFQKGEQ